MNIRSALATRSVKYIYAISDGLWCNDRTRPDVLIENAGHDMRNNFTDLDYPETRTLHNNNNNNNNTSTTTTTTRLLLPRGSIQYGFPYIH